MKDHTDIICAQCGGVNSIPHTHSQDETLEIQTVSPKSMVLLFTCVHCRIQYTLPFCVYEPS